MGLSVGCFNTEIFFYDSIDFMHTWVYKSSEKAHTLAVMDYSDKNDMLAMASV